jgi:hypothetical protein
MSIAWTVSSRVTIVIDSSTWVARGRISDSGFHGGQKKNLVIPGSAQIVGDGMKSIRHFFQLGLMGRRCIEEGSI